MRTLNKVTNLLGLATLMVLGGIQASGADPAADMAALRAIDDAWVQAFNAGDADTMATLYDEHAVLLPPGAPAAKGRAAIRAFFAKMAPAAAKEGLAFALDPKPAGGAHGDFGWMSGAYVLKDKSGRVLETGKYLSVSRKKDGKWLYVRDTWNSDAAPAPAAAEASTKK